MGSQNALMESRSLLSQDRWSDKTLICGIGMENVMVHEVRSSQCVRTNQEGKPMTYLNQRCPVIMTWWSRWLLSVCIRACTSRCHSSSESPACTSWQAQAVKELFHAIMRSKRSASATGRRSTEHCSPNEECAWLWTGRCLLLSRWQQDLNYVNTLLRE